MDILIVYESMDAENNFSENIPVKCVMDFNVEYINNASHLSMSAVHRAAWYKATHEDVAKYKIMVDTNLDKISLPLAALLCNNKFVKFIKHRLMKNEMYDNINSFLVGCM